VGDKYTNLCVVWSISVTKYAQGIGPRRNDLSCGPTEVGGSTLSWVYSFVFARDKQVSGFCIRQHTHTSTRQGTSTLLPSVSLFHTRLVNERVDICYYTDYTKADICFSAFRVQTALERLISLVTSIRTLPRLQHILLYEAASPSFTVQLQNGKYNSILHWPICMGAPSQGA